MTDSGHGVGIFHDGIITLWIDECIICESIEYVEYICEKSLFEKM